MNNKELSLTLDAHLLDEAENILDDFGLDANIAIKMFLKKLIKERNISFLTSSTLASHSNIAPPSPAPLQTAATDNAHSWDNDFQPTRRSNSAINSDMRNFLWTVFKQHKINRDNDNQQLAKMVSSRTGMNQGSAFIYLNMIDNWVNGKSNTRTMKFEDLVFYVQAIKNELNQSAFEATLSSLSDSIEYWDERIPGRFAEKVAQLVKKYRSQG
ncbi:MAG: hypothetical protein FWE03_00880 [Firmicutes bacterium]|nr:hypothetical protein [Bacillota bacterium]